MELKPIQQDMFYRNQWNGNDRYARGRNPIHQFQGKRDQLPAGKQAGMGFEDYLKESFSGRVTREEDWFRKQMDDLLAENRRSVANG